MITSTPLPPPVPGRPPAAACRNSVHADPWAYLIGGPIVVELPRLDLRPTWRDLADQCFCIAGTALLRLGFWLLEHDRLTGAFCPQCGDTMADEDGECRICGATCFTPADTRRWWG